MLAVIPGGELLGDTAKLARGGEKALTAGEDAVRVGEDLERAATAGDKFAEAATEGDKATSRMEQIGEAGESCANLSFTPTTSVAMADGSAKAISALRVGDSVAAYDPKTGVTGAHTVSAVMTHVDPVIEHLSTDQGSIDTTPNHPIFTTDQGWVEAGALRVGEQIRTESGGSASVTGFTLEANPTTMWDITVDGAHSFFVGSGDLLVHNCAAKGVGKNSPNGWQREAGPNDGFAQTSATRDSLNSGFSSMSKDAVLQTSRTVTKWKWAWRIGAAVGIGGLLWALAHGADSVDDPDAWRRP